MKCCDITPGMLIHTIDIERMTNASDGAGGQTKTWATHVAGVRAFVKPLSGREVVHSQRLDAQVSHRIMMRYRADFTPRDRIVFKGRAMQVRAIINLEERDRWFEVMADEGVAT
nr:phage head closure protein [uncultured Roseateles sp.]